ncbi:FAD binding domain-containing protein [Roseobacter sp.]|uniref:FAD binding domain-containing protein n=1 Tax=Roseobacter sp. TaxID=1907202 RepID=UPI00329838D8
MYAFDIERPTTLADAASALGGDAVVMGGGQTLIPTLKSRLASPSTLVSLARVAEMQGISTTGGVLTIGGATVHADVATDRTYGAVSKLAAGIGDPAVRNRGTIGGSVANNDPAACYPAAVLGSGATIVTNTREIAADDFFVGLFETALEEDEIVTAVRFPIPEKANYQKFAQPASRFALVGVFVAKYARGVRVAVTGASNEGVYRWSAAEAALGADFSAAALEGLSVPSDNMISDLHGCGEYRAHLIKVLTGRAVQHAA